MPRVAEGRAAAEPTSAVQRERRDGILRAAAELGTENSLDAVQMTEVATRAGVALGTLYRYFPSKAHLFAGVMVAEVESLSGSIARFADPAKAPHERVADVLWRATRSLLNKPKLTTSMLRSASAGGADVAAELGRIDEQFNALLLEMLGIDVPTVEEAAILRLVQLMWLGLLQATLGARMSMREAESDLRTGCRVMLGSVAR
ncbi:TetR family transcriptional regulator [Speluncibacter jeojiensis]|uniref:TetR family transcriptional regulator n=1 Tax=Speluncibacter jeojiensis TaxID=2710754 RepID=A0A9X4M0W8_9ACTN|nr:TetR family transcriptional regulator [Corynebacteriales bacterium D3-21]